MIQTSFMYLILCVSILGQQNCSRAHPFVLPNVSPFIVFGTRFVSFWDGQQTFPFSIRTKSLLEWYKDLIYTLCNLFKHLQNQIEVMLILFTSKSTSVYQFCSYILDVLEWSTDFCLWYKYNCTSCMIQTSFIYPMWCASKLGWQNWCSACPFFTFKRFTV